MDERVERDLLMTCASIIAHADYLREEAKGFEDREQELAMMGRVDGIVLLAVMMGLSVRRIHDLAAIETERIKLAAMKAA